MSRRVHWLVAVALVWAGAGAALGQGVVAWYGFEDNLLDSSGHGRNGTALGALDYVTGLNGQAIQFDVAADGVDLGVLPIPSAMTVSLRAKFGSDHSAWLVSQMGTVGANWYGWVLKTNLQSGQYVPLLQMGNGTPTRVNLYDATFSTGFDMYDAANPDRWYHIAATHDGVSTVRVYLNGRLYAESTSMPYMSATPHNLTAYVRRPNFSGGPDIMDDVLILNRAMDAGEIAELYDAGVTWPLAVSPGDLQALTALQDSPAPSPVVYTVYNDDGAAVHTVDIAEVDADGNGIDYPWLSVSTAQVADLAASSSATVNAILDHSGVAPGVYNGYLRFSTGATAVTRQIRLTVLGCQWAVTPGSVARYYLDGSGDAVAPVVYTVTNTGKHGLMYTVQEVVDQPWLSLSSAGGGPLNHQETGVVTATVNAAGLAAGEYSCDLRFVNNCSPMNELVYTITLNVENNISLQGVLAYYRFEDSAKDWTGHGYDGTPTGTPAYEEGKDGRCVRFDGVGSGDGVDLGDIPCPASTGPADMSVAVWFRADGLEISASWLVNKISSAGGWKGWQIKTSTEWFGLGWEVPTVNFRWCHDGLRDSLSTSAPNTDLVAPDLYDGNWHLIVFTVEDTDGALGNKVDVRGYYDGALLEGWNIWNSAEWIRFERLNSTFQPAAEDVNVWVSGDTDRVLGGVDELSFWSRALTPTEIAAIWTGDFGLHPLPWPDSDRDGDVDGDDFAGFQRCYTGNAVELTDPAACERFDRDSDNHVDEFDLNEFSQCATGPAIPLDAGNAPPGCQL